ncbi:MAG: 30S ribosome-binding factor RbfA [Alphaproteobacteria bacterium]|nr:30S ribosome-binding factor RbfA [Alphaproteobacteria bacterium]
MKNLKRMPSERQLRVSEEIRRTLAQTFTFEDFYSIGLERGFLMVTEVQISPDFSYSTVFIRAIGNKDSEEFCVLLNKYKGLFRKILSSKLKLRVTPDLIFKVDESFDEAQKIEDILHSDHVEQDLNKKDTQ